MREKAHLKSIIISTFLAAMVLSAIMSSQAFGISYKVIDLNPSGFDNYAAYSISGTQQVGWGGGSPTGGNNHALLWFLWNGITVCADLNPSGFSESSAWGTNGTQQVGFGLRLGTGGHYHALLWNGSPDSYIDLNPSGFGSSEARGTNGTQQVGSGWCSATRSYHALLWNGSAASCVDLNPSGFDSSEAGGTNGTQQVGSGSGSATGGRWIDHALLWNGSADSVIDLHQFLPAGFSESRAYGIDSSGNIVGEAVGNLSNVYHAILWQPVPEPATLLLLGLGAVILRKRKK